MRLGQAVLSLWVVSIIVFGLGRVTGDPVDVLLPIDATHKEREELREQLGFNNPIYLQYINYMRNSFRGDFGESIKYRGHEAMSLVLLRFPTTLLYSKPQSSIANRNLVVNSNSILILKCFISRHKFCGYRYIDSDEGPGRGSGRHCSQGPEPKEILDSGFGRTAAMKRLEIVYGNYYALYMRLFAYKILYSSHKQRIQASWPPFLS